ncbi:MAG: glutaminase A [Fusobacterium sp. JB021]|nr:glutaminase A [Fusobacterium sp. JB020]MDP0492700.1 glutaminase A [Fusobacterium sp. JB021]
MKEYLEELIQEKRKETELGNVASYIPELKNVNKNNLGIYISDVSGNSFFSGDHNEYFTIQSISKIITLMLAIIDNGEEYIFSKVGMEPSGDPFNSIKKLETSTMKKPANPFINAGAIVITSTIKGRNKDDKFQRILNFTRKISEDNSLDVNYKVYCSEARTGDRNKALAYFLKGQGIIEESVPDSLDLYFKQCSIEITAKHLATIALFLARNGKNSKNEQIIDSNIVKIVKTLMYTCGLYDESGEFAVKIGIPSKSGVGGGILCVVPGKMGIGVYGPALNEHGNSLAGISLLENLSNKFNLSIF